jgi:hypothetical protein
MSLANSGSQITIFEKMLVPGDYTHYEVLYETDVWQGPPVKKQPPPIPIHVQAGPTQFGADPHKDTLNKITQALGGLLTKQMGQVIPNPQLINRRDWQG